MKENKSLTIGDLFMMCKEQVEAGNGDRLIRVSNVENVCPCCNGERLEYGVFELVDDMGFYPWECKDCCATGNEWYDLVFSQHYNVYDKNGNEIEY